MKKNGHVQPVSNSYCDSTESCCGLFRMELEFTGSVPQLVSHSILQSRVYGSLPNPAWIFTANHAIRQPGHATSSIFSSNTFRKVCASIPNPCFSLSATPQVCIVKPYIISK